MDKRARELAFLIGEWFMRQAGGLSQMGRRKGHQEVEGPGENGGKGDW